MKYILLKIIIFLNTKKMKNFITNLDFLSLKIDFRFNDKGEKRHKTFLGGVMSGIYMIIIFLILIYFIFRYLSGEDLNVNYSIEKSKNINMTYSNKLPFMLRLTDYDKIAIDPENIFNITLRVWYNYYNENYGDYIIDKYDLIPVEKCDINKHFGEYKKYFKTILHLDTFMCPQERFYNQTLYGIYGDATEFSLYHFFFTKCDPLYNKNCIYNEITEDLLSNAYLDLIYVDYSINNLNKTDVKKVSIQRERIGISSSVYKRVWIFFRNIKYYTDFGLFYSRIQEENFHQLDSIRIDTDLKDINNSAERGTFLTLSFANSGNIGVYNRKYLRFQDYLATISGIFKFLFLLIEVINYNNAQNSFYRKIIRDFIIDNNIQRNNFKSSSINIDRSENKLISNGGVRKINSVKIRNKGKKIEKTIKEKEYFDSIYKSFFLPLKWIPKNKNDRIRIRWYIRVVNNRLSIIKILNSLEKIEKSYNFYFHEPIFFQDSLNNALQNNFIFNTNKKTNKYHKYITDINDN